MRKGLDFDVELKPPISSGDGGARPKREIDALKTIEATDVLAVEITTAIQAGDVGALSQLLSDHPWAASAGIVDGRGVTRLLLHIATDWPGHFPNGPDVVRALVDAGADPGARVVKAESDEVGETPLHWAASSNDVAVLDTLIELGADLEAMGAVLTGGTPMSDAVVFAQWDSARRLLAHGAKTTLWQAAALGLVDRVKLMLAHRPEPSDRDITNAFWHACRGGQRDAAALLLEYGAEVGWVGYDHRTPLDAAKQSGSRDLITWLKEAIARSRGDLD
jgi:hypothetical protein